MKKIILWVIVCIFLVSCTTTETTPTQAPTAVPTTTVQPATPIPTAIPTATTIPPQMDQEPLVWFAPLPPMPQNAGRLYFGSEDYMDLFQADAPWVKAAEHIDIFKFYGEWVAHNVGSDRLQQAVLDLNRRGIPIGIETGPLDPDETCGQNTEGFATIQASMDMLQAVKDAGGIVQVIALDEPFYYAKHYDGANACHWDTEKIAAEVDEFIDAARTIFPEIIVGDIEPLTGPADANEMQAWLETFEQVNGYPLAFLHLDIDWSRPTWVEETGQLVAYGVEHDIPIGMIYFGNHFDPDDATYLAVAGERIKKLELEAGVLPQHIIFQSWNDKPDYVLPETQANTWTSFINQYFSDKSSLGFATEGAGANLALNRPVTVSKVHEDFGGEFAVDGDTGTVWNSGGDAQQWLEIDLEGSHTVAEVRLTISQYPAGATVHELWAITADGGNILLETFTETTDDGDALLWQAESPLTDVIAIRVVTTVSPSWVSWREIEVIAGAEE